MMTSAVCSLSLCGVCVCVCAPTRYQIKARKGIISQFSEVATERDKFMVR